MAERTFNEWFMHEFETDIWNGDYDRSHLEEAWNAATKAAEEKFNSAAQSGPTNTATTPCSHEWQNGAGVLFCSKCHEVDGL